MESNLSAETIGALSGDHVKADPIERMIVLLDRAAQKQTVHILYGWISSYIPHRSHGESN